ncbi:MAG: YdeI/OmpD-associated family protein [bacterium]
MKSKNKMEKVYLANRKEWRTWLEKNHALSSGIWLIFYKKHTDKPVLEYNAAVEEALCFGWIDSIIKKLDAERYMRKFTPRNSLSYWSDINKKRVEKMIEQGKMTAYGMSKIQTAKKSGKWYKSPRPDISFEIPEEFKQALNNDPEAKKFFDTLAPSYKKQYLGWISTAKRQETRQKRINEAISLLTRGEKLGLK